MPVSTSPGRTARRLVAATSFALLLPIAAPALAADPDNSPLDARLFYQLMIGAQLL